MDKKLPPIVGNPELAAAVERLKKAIESKPDVAAANRQADADRKARDEALERDQAAHAGDRGRTNYQALKKAGRIIPRGSEPLPDEPERKKLWWEDEK